MKNGDDKKTATTEARKDNETQRFSVSETSEDSAVAREALEKKIEENEEKYKRALADYQNLQKRNLADRREWIELANKELLLRILPVLDTLELANKHVQNVGIKVSIQQFLDILKSEGVIKIETAGKAFDPRLMEVIATEEVDPSTGSGQEEGKVIEEVRAGYMLNDKVLRVAQVKVGKS